LSRHGNHYAARFLSPLGLALVFIGFIANTVVSAMAIYLRAHKQEKFMWLSVFGSVYTVPMAWYFGHRYGGVGIAATYAFGALVIGVGAGTVIFLKWRRIWHTSPDTLPVAQVPA
jgi:O-antigen/teichoic acid export membrane protein